MTLRVTPAQAKALGVCGSELKGLKGSAPARTPRRRFEPEEVLASAALQRFPGGVREYPCIPGRRFRLDIAWPDARPPVAVEVDGWAFHGRFKRDFHRDREKRNLLALHGWLVLAIPARDIHRDIQGVLDKIGQALTPVKSFEEEAVKHE